MSAILKLEISTELPHVSNTNGTKLYFLDPKFKFRALPVCKSRNLYMKTEYPLSRYF